MTLVEDALKSRLNRPGGGVFMVLPANEKEVMLLIFEAHQLDGHPEWVALRAKGDFAGAAKAMYVAGVRPACNITMLWDTAALIAGALATQAELAAVGAQVVSVQSERASRVVRERVVE